MAPFTFKSRMQYFRFVNIGKSGHKGVRQCHHCHLLNGTLDLKNCIYNQIIFQWLHFMQDLGHITKVKKIPSTLSGRRLYFLEQKLLSSLFTVDRCLYNHETVIMVQCQLKLYSIIRLTSVKHSVTSWEKLGNFTNPHKGLLLVKSQAEGKALHQRLETNLFAKNKNS